MRKVTKTYNNPPKILTEVSCEDKILRAVVAESAKNSEGKDIYNGYHYSHEDVKAALNIIYHQKCAYCEMNVPKLEVEHYRPKKEIRKKIINSKGEEVGVKDTTHKGYYWLGCEWSNLLLACSSCNDQGAKGNFFPIEGNRVKWCIPFTEEGKLDRSDLIADQSPLKDEYPLLLNPEIDYPEEHLSFNYLGRMEYLTKKGKESRDTYKLNRDFLYSKRQDVVNDYVIELKIILEKANRGDYAMPNGYKNTLRELFEKIEQANIETQEYILWRRYIFNNFSDCILSRIEASFRRNIERAFIMYRQGKL